MRGMIGRYGRLVVASVGVASTTLLVAHCASPQKPAVVISPPDITPIQRWDFNWDRRDPRFLKQKVFRNLNFQGSTGGCDNKEDENLEYPKARRNLFLVRHGQYNGSGDDDNCHTLTKLGQEQAVLAGQRLKNSGIKFTSIVCSGMTRAIQTAEIIHKQMDNQPGLKLEIRDPILNEGPPCIPEPPYPHLDIWDPDFNEFYAEGARIEAAFRKYFHRADLKQQDDSNEIIVCHGNVIRYFSLRALQFPPEGWLRISIDHTSLTKFSLLPNGDVVLRALGDSGHLPADKATA